MAILLDSSQGDCCNTADALRATIQRIGFLCLAFFIFLALYGLPDTTESGTCPFSMLYSGVGAHVGF